MSSEDSPGSAHLASAPSSRRWTTGSTVGLPRSALRMVAVASLSLAAVKPQPALAATAAAVGLIMFAWALRAGDGGVGASIHRWGALAAIVVVALGSGVQVGPMPDSMTTLRPLWTTLLVVSALVALVGRRGSLTKRVSVLIGLVGLVIAIGSFISGEWNSDLGFDVYHAHKAAGSALVAGENPYTDAVTVVDGSFYAEDDAAIEGYTYPPVVLFTYGLVGAFTDPRLVTTIAWLAIVGWFASRALRDDEDSNVAFAVFLLLASTPVWPVIWLSSWTEPMSLGLLLIAAVLWRRVVLSGIALGLAVASKQYFVFLLPLLLLHRERQHSKRMAVAISVAALTVLPFLIINPRALLTATILNPSNIGFRPDTQSIAGLLNASGISFELPAWAWFGLGIGVAYALGRGSVSRGSLIGRAGLVLGVVFITGLAFPNYWFLVLTMLALGAVMSEADKREPLPTRSAALP